METQRSANLCNIYVLPLISLNRHSFGEGKFVNSYLSKDDEYIVVESTHPFTTIIINSPNYMTSRPNNENYLAIFRVPEYYRSDVIKFRKGQYSKFTEAAKNLIRKKSGLIYRTPGLNGKYNTSLELLALDKDPILKQYWEDKLSNPHSKVILDDNAELASMPDDNNFFSLDLETQLITT